MRADYGLYIVAIICFIIAGLVFLDVVPQYLPKPTTFEATAMTVIFSALGLIFAILGYALRPKPIISISEPPKPALPPSTMPPAEETTAAPPSEPTPLAPPQEETAKPKKRKPKAKTRRKRTKRRKRKA